MCIILISACVVDDFGTHPNWLALIFLSIACLTYSSTTNSSATLDNIGVREIGRRCLLTSVTGFCLGTGTISAIFQDIGRQPSLYELFKMSIIGAVKTSAFSFKSQAGTPSGLAPWWGLILITLYRRRGR
jgi:hypothetical protein